MKRNSTIVFGFLAIFFGLIIQSCSDDDDDDDPITEFIADDNTFADFEDWTLEAERAGVDVALGMAHGGEIQESTRKIYFKDGQDPVDGAFPVGTLIAKKTDKGDGTFEYTAMAKRGNGFATATGDWEWFMLNADGSIASDPDGNAMRGASLMNGMCSGCHSTTTGTDYSFVK